MKKASFYQYSIKTQVLFNFLFIILFTLFSSFSNRNNDYYSNEKIYIQFDKPNYYAGEDIWFKTYLLDAATHTPKTWSKVTYVELINPRNEIIETKTIKITDGGGEGNFELSPDLISGEYTVRAYTNYMRNFDSAYFFRKKVYIKALKSDGTINKVPDANIVDKAKPDIQFFPEGGYLVNGFLNRVGFKAVGVNGEGIAIEGTITDNASKEILELKTSKFGMGVFEFIPKPDSSYKLNIVHEGVKLIYDLPIGIGHGTVMQVTEHDKDFRITLQSSLNNGLKNFSLLGTQREGAVIRVKLKGAKSKSVIKVPKRILEQGIVQFTLFDNNKKPISERLSFYETDKASVNVSIKPSKKEYGKRELVKLEIHIDSIIQEKVQPNMSIAVTDMSAIEPDPFGLGIKSQLLLKSELKGNIEKPGYYFNSDDPDRKRNLDILMMTQGWRKFITNDTLNDPSKPIFFAETGISLSGQIKNFYNHNKSAIAEVSLTYDNSKELVHEVMLTDNNGQFAFNNLNFLDTTSVIIQAKKIKNTEQRKRAKNPIMNFHIEMDSFVAPEITLKQKQRPEGFSRGPKNIATAYLESLYQMPKGTIELDEVVLEEVITDRNSQYKKKRSLSLYKEPSHTIDFKDIKGLPYDNWLIGLVGRIPGYSASGTLRGNISLGNSLPLYLLDGMPVEDVDDIAFLDIDFIDIVKGPRAAIYGLRAGGGVIAIYTKDGSEKPNTAEDYKKRGIVSFEHPGYQAKKFYEPVYKTQKKEDTKSDYRSTIYWNPTIRLDEQNKANISFYTSDVTSPYQIVLEGISLDGEIISAVTYLNLP
ncbi:TonB-dependent receptor plug domain-containing protein [Maribacter sp. HTCC2170]|uniref:TonB-dependent receptor plug domain-containing protein n=1 Tax=Maribacter sp. (strain HTCC2170 / KCCM 42371) TaxID=313603 RepID=UPI00006BB139|nr:TonB-dependent receptor plug domain-containing protein [Maribacter sp. HTCC2170]EAQ99606.1 hypothetical protein FB2170_00085 [Maribacter sp. HTCC2170]